MKSKGFFASLWKWTKRVLLWLFIAHLIYIVALKWINPPITITQLSSWIRGEGLKRDYVNGSSMSYLAKLAVIASEMARFCVGAIPFSSGAQTLLRTNGDSPFTRRNDASGDAHGGWHPGACISGCEKGTPASAASCAGQDCG